MKTVSPPSPIAGVQILAARLILKWLFLPAPAVELSNHKKEAFDALLKQSYDSGVVDYVLPYPRHEFLRHLVENRGLLLHGSQRGDIDLLTPRLQTDWSGKEITAVFATQDAYWPLYFAILDTTGYRGSLRNGCFVAGKDRFYFFSINAKAYKRQPWRDGTVYIMPSGSFLRAGSGPVRFDEWISTDPVKPLAKLRVSPADFPFMSNVTAHNESESIYLTWLRYKRRQDLSTQPGAKES